MVKAGDWIGLSVFIDRHNWAPRFTSGMRPRREITLPGAKGGESTKIVEGRYLDQAYSLLGAFPIALNAWNGHEREIAAFLARTQPFGPTRVFNSKGREMVRAGRGFGVVRKAGKPRKAKAGNPRVGARPRSAKDEALMELNRLAARLMLTSR